MKHKTKFTTRCSIAGIISVALVISMALIFAAPVSGADTVYDMTTDTYPAKNQTWTINGAIWAFLPSTDPTGSGVFDSFLRVAASPHERGYNTDFRPVQFDEKTSSTFTHSELLSLVSIVEYNGGLYREFQVDLNEAASTPYISLDQFQVWVTDNPSISGYNEATNSFASGATLVYDLDVGPDGDSTIMMDYQVNKGSGKRDYKVLVPLSMFDGKTGAYVVLFTRHGNYDAVYNGIDTGNADSDFEEWGVAVYDTKSGVKFNDKDRDCVQDIGELGLQGWKIYVDLNENGSWDPFEPYATTNSSGGYIIYNIPKPEKGKTFITREVLQEGWTQSCPASGYYEDTWGGRVLHPNNNFGNYRCCLDVIKGSIDACYPDVNSAEAAAIAATTATDTCSGVVPDKTASTVGTCNAVITVTATDVCGNSANVTYNTRIDNTPPVLGNLPSGGDLGCNPIVPTCEDFDVTAYDVCDGALEVTCEAGEIIDLGDCSFEQTFTFSAEDECGNYVEDSVTYTWKVDEAAPELSGVPDDEDLGCNPIVPTCEDFNVTAYDVCDGALEVTCEAGEIIDLGDCSFEQTFTFSAEDECGNYVEDSVTYTWKVDETAPVLYDVPAGGDLGCSEPPSCDPNVTAIDNCDGSVEVICTPGPITGTTCNWTQTFTYWAVDSCGNNASANVTYTWREPECCITCGTAVAAQGPVDPGQFLFGGKQDNWFTYIIYNKGEGSAGSPKEYPIFAGQTQRVGTLYVYDNGTHVFVRYCADVGLGVDISSYHLEVVDEFSGFNRIRTRWHGIYGNPIPGRCEYSGSYPGIQTCSDWIESVNDNISTYGDDIYIFAHSIMCWYQD